MKKIRSALKDAIKKLYGLDIEPRIESSEHADFTSNVAMQIAGRVGKSPREVGEELAGALEGYVVEVAGPGFLNFSYSDAEMLQQLDESLEEGSKFYAYDKYAGQVIVTEFSDPNPFKVLHIGHFYTSVVGDAVSRLFEYAGGEVHRVNFGGDVGLHVGKTLWAVMKQLALPAEASVEAALAHRIFDAERADAGGVDDELRLDEKMDFIAARYVEGTNAYDSGAEAHDEIVEINKQVYAIIANDERESVLAQVYWQCREWSYAYFDAFYARVGVSFEKYYAESAVAGLGLATVRRELKAGVYEESDGAVVFRGEPYGLHTRVFVNAVGLPTYEATDVGLIEQKWADYKFDQSVVITAADITDYMRVVLKSVEQFDPELPKRTRHIVHGNVTLPGAVKMSSRKGNFVRAVEVLQQVTEEQKAVNGKADEAVALGAAKYAFLKSKIEPGNIIFDIKESVNLRGNSGPYLQYSLARAKSILRKVGDKTTDEANIQLDEYERGLLLKLLQWREEVRRAVDELAPHRVCTYLYELAQVFSRFYENDQVAGGEHEQTRKKLVQAYVGVLEVGLRVLGMPSVERI
jgi:arginyl-tRNA synthetase